MDAHQENLVKTAQRLGIEVELMEEKWKIDAVRLYYEDKSTIVLKGRVFTHLNYIADIIGSNKIASKSVLKELGIPVPNSYSFSCEHIDKNKIEAFLNIHGVIVAKPISGSEGEGIAMYLSNVHEVIKHIKEFSSLGEYWLLEEQINGKDLRLQYLSGKLIAACIRKPCTLVGDGKSTISHLIKQRNKLIRSQNPNNHIDIDQQVKRRLSDGNLTLDSILPVNQTLQIKDVTNMAQGGHAIDVTNQVHPRYEDYLNKLSDSLGIKFFSLDVMTVYPEADPAKYAHVLELNTRSMWLHHTFSEVHQHDIAKLILEDYFNMKKV